MDISIHYSSKCMTWETPAWLFNELDREFHFTLDVCAEAHNTKCARFYSLEDNGLVQDWGNEICWCNPPYGGAISKWLAKAENAAAHGATVVCLIPARTDTQWFHRYVWGKAEVRFLKGRIKFAGAKWNAPFPSMIVVYRGQGNGA